MNLHFYQCDICGKIITVLSDTGVPTECCGQAMRELEPNMTDGALEKHVPVLFIEGQSALVQIGSFPHPMTDSHSITWIGLKTGTGFLFRELKPGDVPEAVFFLGPGDSAEAAYAFCNLHGLWCAKAQKPSEKQ